MNWEMALEMAAISHSVYDEDLHIHWADHYHEIEKFEHAKTDTEAYVMCDGEKVVLAFRGTDTLVDWKYNLFAWKKNRNKWGKAHAGFGYSAVGILSEPKLHRFLDRHKDLPLYITGHSKGAALAIISSAYLKRTEHVYAFGCPNLGNRSFAKNHPFLDRISILINRRDPVRYLPPFFMNYFRMRAKIVFIMRYEKASGHGGSDYVDAVNWYFRHPEECEL